MPRVRKTCILAPVPIGPAGERTHGYDTQVGSEKVSGKESARQESRNPKENIGQQVSRRKRWQGSAAQGRREKIDCQESAITQGHGEEGSRPEGRNKEGRCKKSCDQEDVEQEGGDKARGSKKVEREKVVAPEGSTEEGGREEGRGEASHRDGQAGRWQGWREVGHEEAGVAPAR